jgi:hypothetical protein
VTAACRGRLLAPSLMPSVEQISRRLVDRHAPFASQDAEPALDRVQPRGADRREVELDPGLARPAKARPDRVVSAVRRGAASLGAVTAVVGENQRVVEGERIG